MKVKSVVPTPTALNWAKLLEEDQVTFGTVESAKKKNIFPNRLAWVPEHPGVGALAVFQSQEDFAIGKAGLDYILNAQRDGRIQEGYVLLLGKSGPPYVYVNSAPAAEVAEALAEEPLRDGKWGAFRWVASELIPKCEPF